MMGSSFKSFKELLLREKRDQRMSRKVNDHHWTSKNHGMLIIFYMMDTHSEK